MDSEQINALYQVGGAVAVVVVGAFFGIQWVLRTVATIKPFDVKTEKTTIITADTVAMDALAKSVEALNVTVTETNMLIKRELSDREIEEEVERRLLARGIK